MIGCGTSVGSNLFWDASNTEIFPCVCHILSRRFGHENNSSDIFPLPLIQEEHLSVDGERMHSSGKLRLGHLHCVVRITDCHNMTSAVYRGCKATNQTTNQNYKGDNIKKVAWYDKFPFHGSRLCLMFLLQRGTT